MSIELRWSKWTEVRPNVLQYRDDGWNWNYNVKNWEVNKFFNPSMRTEWADVPVASVVEEKVKERTLADRFRSIIGPNYENELIWDLVKEAEAHFKERESKCLCYKSHTTEPVSCGCYCHEEGKFKDRGRA